MPPQVQQLPPAGWHPDPHGGPGQRYWDGTAWTEHVQVPQPPPLAPGSAPPPTGPPKALVTAFAQPGPKHGNGKGKGKWIAVAIVIMAIIGAAGSSSEEDSDRTSAGGAIAAADASTADPSSPVRAAARTKQKAKSKPAAGGFEADTDYVPHMGAGKAVKVDGVRYTVLSATTATEIGGEYFGETADGEFLILEISARNDRKESSLLTDSVMSIERNGKVYEPDSEGTVAYLLDQGGRQSEQPFFLRDIQPDTTTKGYVVFDLPSAVANDPDLEVRFNELGFGQNHGYTKLPPR